MAQHRKGGNFKSKSRYTSLYFLVQVGVGFFPAFFSSCDCLKVRAKRFVGSAVAYPPTASLMLGVVKDTAFNSTFLENAQCCSLSIIESWAGGI